MWMGRILDIHTFHTLDSRYLCQLTPLLLLRCILMRSVPDSQWKVFSSSQELKEWMPVCGAVYAVHENHDGSATVERKERRKYKSN